MFLFEKIKKTMSSLILSFSEIPKTVICVRLRKVAFLSEDWKSCPSEAVSSLRFSLGAGELKHPFLQLKSSFRFRS